MSSDNKALRVFQKVCIKPSFEKEVQRLRAKYMVPRDGFETRQEVDGWDLKRNDEYITDLLSQSRKKIFFQDFDSDLLSVLAKHKLSPTLFPLLNDYIASNKIEYGELPYYACAVDIDRGPFQRISENHWRASGVRFVKLLISEDAEISDVRKYVKERWKQMRVHMGALQKKSERIKSSQNWERDRLIYDLSRNKKKELEVELKQFDPDHPGGTKEMIIGKLMPKYRFPKLSGDAIAKVIERQLAARKSDKLHSV